MLCYAAGARVRHDAPQMLEPMPSNETSTSTASTATVSYGLHNDVVVHRHRHQPLPRRPRPPGVAPGPAATLNASVSSTWEPTSLSDYQLSPKVSDFAIIVDAGRAVCAKRLCNGRVSVRPSVCLSVPSIDGSSDVRRDTRLNTFTQCFPSLLSVFLTLAA